MDSKAFIFIFPVCNDADFAGVADLSCQLESILVMKTHHVVFWVPSGDNKRLFIGLDDVGTGRQICAVHRPDSFKVDERSVFTVHVERRRVAHLNIWVGKGLTILDAVPCACAA